MKKIGNLIKIYINNNKKYNKKIKKNILNFKLVIFYNYCNKLEISNKQFYNAYSTILKEQI